MKKIVAVDFVTLLRTTNSIPLPLAANWPLIETKPNYRRPLTSLLMWCAVVCVACLSTQLRAWSKNNIKTSSYSIEEYQKLPYNFFWYRHCYFLTFKLTACKKPPEKKNFHPNLGAMYMLMSFIGCMSTLMGNTGLTEVTAVCIWRSR